MYSRRQFLHSCWAGAALIAVRAGAATLPIRVGVTAGPHAEVMSLVKQLAAVNGLSIELQVRPKDAINLALANGSLDAASFQSGPLFQADPYVSSKALASTARTLTLPTALYSKKITSLSRLKAGDRIAIAQDGPGTARALILLHNLGLLLLRENAPINPTPADIVSNRLQLKLLRLPATQLPASLDKAAFAVLDYATATKAGWQPGRDSIAIEDAFTPFADVLTVRRQDLEQPWVKTLVDAYQSEPVKRFLLERYQESVRRPW